LDSALPCTTDVARRWLSGAGHDFSTETKISVDVSVLMCIYTHMPEDFDFLSRRNCVCFNLRRVTRVVTQFFDTELRRHGIRSTQGSVLNALHAIGPSNMAELSDVLGMERTTLLRNLRPLQRDGLVAVEGGGRGGRVELSITAKGRKQIEKLAPACESAQRTAIQVLGEKRWSVLLADLDAVASALKT
jgi:DNA-binding MarR family transcriptional regulator